MKRKKHGLSEMVGYVLLIVIAISLSIMVYAWLKYIGYHPQEACNDGISISIDNYLCDSTSHIITVSMRNTGTFNIWGFIIRGRNSTNAIKPLKAAEDQTSTIFEANIGKIIFEDIGDATKPRNPMTPNEARDFFFEYGVLNNLTVLDVEPIQIKDTTILLCEGATIHQEIRNCQT